MSIEIFKVSIEQETEHEILMYSKLFQTLEGVNSYLNIKWNEWFLEENDSLEKVSLNTEEVDKSCNLSSKSSICSSDINDTDSEDSEEKWDIPDKEIISIQTLKNIVENNKINETRSIKILEYGEGNIAKYAIVVRLNKIIVGN
jgi:hypothetical protein